MENEGSHLELESHISFINLKNVTNLVFYNIELVFYSSFFYNNKIRYNIKRYNKQFRLKILLLPLQSHWEENLCMGVIPILPSDHLIIITIL